MVVLVVVMVSVAAGTGAALLVRHWPRADPASSVTETVGRKLGSHRRARRFLSSRMNPATATGLVLTAALVGLVLTGAIIGLLVWMIRRDSGLVNVDRAIESWADRRATAFSDDVLGLMTHLGDTETVIVIAVAVSVYGLWRWRKPTILLFVTAVVLGQSLISNTIKLVIDRARPELRPRADFTGTSFPSGHTTAAAATYLAVALVLAIASSPKARAALAGGAIAIGVAVGCTRVFLGVHWFTDAMAGLAIGWTWFGLCAVAFGGRLLRFGEPAKVAAAAEQDGNEPRRSASSTSPATRASRTAGSSAS